MSVEAAFGQVLKELRSERGLSQEALAAEAGVARNYVSLLELGRNSVSLVKLFPLAAALGVSASELIQRTERTLKSPRA